jgi:pimeloyl-ACP methyl ester carboxylesterase
MKTFIKNRNGQNISIILEENKNPKGLAFVMHGLGGFKEQPHIETFATAFKDANFTVIRFDTTNSFGESDGNYENATITNYYEDLEDVIDWAKNENWYKEPFVLVGHSLGGICSLLYAQKFPEKIKAIAPISTVVSGLLSLETGRDEIREWEKTGWRISESKTKPGLVKKLPWSHMEDRLKYNILDNIEKLTMPVLLIVGDLDDSTPLEHQKILFEKLTSKKELHIINGAEHTFREQKHLAEIRSIMLKWVNNIL